MKIRIDLPPALRRLALALAAFFYASSPAAAQEVWALDTKAPYVFVVDAETGDVLMEKEADTLFPPASMSKLMTAAMTFDALSTGRLSMEDPFPVSEAAFRKEGSTMCLNLGDQPKVADLLRGLIVMSGNDAAIALAEGIAGSEEAFAQRMTARARELGMTSSIFGNATGLPNPDHKMTARDLATLALYIISAHQEYFPIYSETEFGWATCVQANRNPLLYLDPEFGGDGMKTGYTDESGYGIVATAERDGRRVVAVLSGLESVQDRSREAQKVISWAFREFRNVTLVKAGDVVGRADVWLGAADSVPLAVAEDLRVTLPFIQAEDIETSIQYQGPIQAPVEAGTKVGELIIAIKGLPQRKVPLVTAEAVEKGGFMVRLGAIVELMISGKLAGAAEK